MGESAWRLEYGAGCRAYVLAFRSGDQSARLDCDAARRRHRRHPGASGANHRNAPAGGLAQRLGRCSVGPGHWRDHPCFRPHACGLCLGDCRRSPWRGRAHICRQHGGHAQIAGTAFAKNELVLASGLARSRASICGRGRYCRCRPGGQSHHALRRTCRIHPLRAAHGDARWRRGHACIDFFPERALGCGGLYQRHCAGQPAHGGCGRAGRRGRHDPHPTDVPRHEPEPGGGAARIPVRHETRRAGSRCICDRTTARR